jgi:hypothetical protein
MHTAFSTILVVFAGIAVAAPAPANPVARNLDGRVEHKVYRDATALIALTLTKCVQRPFSMLWILIVLFAGTNRRSLTAAIRGPAKRSPTGSTCWKCIRLAKRG